MTDGVRLNKVIGLLEQGKAVFCGGIIPNGNLDDVMYMADSDYDFCIIENEHEGFSFNNLRNSMQHLLTRATGSESRKRVACSLTSCPSSEFLRMPGRPPTTSGSSSRPWTQGSTAL